MKSLDELEEALQAISAAGGAMGESQDMEEIAALQMAYGALAWCADDRHPEAVRFAGRLRVWARAKEKRRS